MTEPKPARKPEPSSQKLSHEPKPARKPQPIPRQVENEPKPARNLQPISQKGNNAPKQTPKYRHSYRNVKNTPADDLAQRARASFQVKKRPPNSRTHRAKSISLVWPAKYTEQTQ